MTRGRSLTQDLAEKLMAASKHKALVVGAWGLGWLVNEPWLFSFFNPWWLNLFNQ